MKVTYEHVMDFIAKEVMEEIKYCHWNNYDEIGLNRQLDDYIKELKKRIFEEHWEGIDESNT